MGHMSVADAAPSPLLPLLPLLVRLALLAAPLPFHAPFDALPQPLIIGGSDGGCDDGGGGEGAVVMGGARKICMRSVCCMKANWSAVFSTDDVMITSRLLDEAPSSAEAASPVAPEGDISPRQNPTGIVAAFLFSEPHFLCGMIVSWAGDAGIKLLFRRQIDCFIRTGVRIIEARGIRSHDLRSRCVHVRYFPHSLSLFFRWQRHFLPPSPHFGGRKPKAISRAHRPLPTPVQIAIVFIGSRSAHGRLTVGSRSVGEILRLTVW